jgi:CDP-diacylglycerol--glycerol-3-phosphate 3-phosphatidyltransferase
MDRKEIFTVSNLMSFLRIFLAAPIYFYISVQENLLAVSFIILAMITDWLDGYFARKWHQITTVGKIIDPLADKICTIAGFVALTQYQALPLWITVTIIGRDMLIIAASLIVIGRRNLVIASNVPGKMAVFLITLLGIVYLIPVEVLKDPIIILCALSIGFSLVNYAIEFLKKLSGDNER